MSRSTHQFSQTKSAEIPRSSFDLSHGYKTTLDAGQLVPILVLEVLPGDTINLRASLFGRMATPIKPLMDNLYLESFFFFSPARQLWENFQKFMGEQASPGDSIDYTIPLLGSVDVVATGKLGDYFGLPLALNPSETPVSALPFRMYGQVYDFWFRDENLVGGVLVPRDDGPDTGTTSNFTLNSTPRRRRKRRDYITSALPFPQKGPDVVVSLGDSAPVVSDPNTDGIPQFNVGTASGPLQSRLSQDTTHWSAGGSGVTDAAWQDPRLIADLENATSISINDLRESFQIQKLLERDARGGTRYPEILMSHFRVSDPGLLIHQRPVFLGGGQSSVNINPVTQQSPSDIAPDLTPQGNLAGYGTVSGGNHGFTASFTEHGLVMGIVNIRADLTYQQGLERYWSRQTRYDFYWPALSHLGEQAILNKEVYVSNDPLVDDDVFGYIPRYDEYRYKQSNITGQFRSEYTASLDVWHLAQDFAALPVLGKDFIEDNPPMERVSAVPSEPDFLLDVWFKIRAARPLPLYATPGLIDHF